MCLGLVSIGKKAINSENLIYENEAICVNGYLPMLHRS
jgi:hypothetical protein